MQWGSGAAPHQPSSRVLRRIGVGLPVAQATVWWPFQHGDPVGCGVVFRILAAAQPNPIQPNRHASASLETRIERRLQSRKSFAGMRFAALT
jgi:hypothetical protein